MDKHEHEDRSAIGMPVDGASVLSPQLDDDDAYVAIVHEDDGRYTIRFPDFPHCHASADSLEDCVRKGHKALARCIAEMERNGEPLPAPTPYDDLVDSDAVDRTAATESLIRVPKAPAVADDVKVRFSLAGGNKVMSAITDLASAVGLSPESFLKSLTGRRKR